MNPVLLLRIFVAHTLVRHDFNIDTHEIRDNSGGNRAVTRPSVSPRSLLHQKFPRVMKNFGLRHGCKEYLLSPAMEGDGEISHTARAV